MSDNRVHVFRCVDPAAAMADRTYLRTIARILTADCDCTVNERFAESLDEVIGGDDAACAGSTDS